MKSRNCVLFGAVALILAGMILLPGCETTGPGTVDVEDVPPPDKPPPMPIKPPPIPTAVTKATIPVDLTKYYNVNAFEGSAEQSGGFDTWGNAYPPQLMPKETTYTDGATKVVFSIPDPTKEPMNCITANGENIKVVFGKYSTLYIAACATGGNLEGEITLQYATGQKTVPLKITDWCAAEAAFDEATYATFDHRVVPDATEGEEAEKDCAIWIQTIELDKASTLTSIILPANKNLHVFGISLAP